ncbi:hypothetical protein Hanom_Chr07g00638351 [Helianthus anomalus]
MTSTAAAVSGGVALSPVLSLFLFLSRLSLSRLCLFQPPLTTTGRCWWSVLSSKRGGAGVAGDEERWVWPVGYRCRQSPSAATTDGGRRSVVERERGIRVR